MKLARYMGSGIVEIVDEPIPECPPGGLLVKTEACGLCSGELMDWYMDRKIPHVLGHEVAGTVVESQDELFPVGSRVFSHHHAPCLKCVLCHKGLFVHCSQWKRTKLIPGGMSEFFAVPADNLIDTLDIGDLKAEDAALIEPLACVVKSLSLAPGADSDSYSVVGLGVMGLMHALLLPNCVGWDLSEDRVARARELGIDARQNSKACGQASITFVCPGSQAAFDFALENSRPGGTIVMFAPLPPDQDLKVSQTAYFKDIRIANSYSCGPTDTRRAKELIEAGTVTAQKVVSDFIAIEELPAAYGKMKAGEILKPMVLF